MRAFCACASHACADGRDARASPGILPGNIVQINGIGDRFQGKLYVSGVRQTICGGNWETDVQFGLNPELFAETYNLRPLPASGLLPAVSGLQMGIVSQLENDPDGEDRIKCRVPLISTSEDGIWARLATLDAGKNRGTYFRPEIGDEVVVGFLDGDPRYPVILGQCNSSAKPSPETAKDANDLKGYVSREKLKLTFDDDKKIVGIETPAGNKITLSEDAKGIELEDQNGNKITLDDSGITIESAKDLTLKASGDVKLSGNERRIQRAKRVQGVGHEHGGSIGRANEDQRRRNDRDQGRNGADQLMRFVRGRTCVASERWVEEKAMSFAARVSDMIVSTATNGAPVPIVPPGAPTVLIGGLPAARAGDGCGADVIALGSMTVLIGGMPAARIGDITGGGGSVVAVGAPTVLIGG